MPYVPAKEYKKTQLMLKNYLLFLKANTWRCFVCQKKFCGFESLLSLNRYGWEICKEDKTLSFQKKALLFIKILSKHHVVDDFQTQVLQYLYGGDDEHLHLLGEWRNEASLNSLCEDLYDSTAASDAARYYNDIY